MKLDYGCNIENGDYRCEEHVPTVVEIPEEISIIGFLLDDLPFNVFARIASFEIEVPWSDREVEMTVNLRGSSIITR